MKAKGVLLLLLSLLIAVAGCGQNQARPEHSMVDHSAYYESVRQALDAEVMTSPTVYYDDASSRLCYFAIVEGEVKLYCKSEEGGGPLPSYVYPEMSADAGGSLPRGLTGDGAGGWWLAIAYGKDQRLLLQHIDSEGAELALIDTAASLPQAEFQLMTGLVADSEGRLYLHDTADNLYVLDAQGELAFSLESDAGPRQLLRLPSGTVAAIITTPQGTALRKVNAARRNWGERIALPFDPDRVYPCQSYTLLYSDMSSLYGYDATTNTSTKLLTWIDCGLDIGNILQVSLGDDGRIICASRRDNAPGQLITLTNSGQATRPVTTVITLASTFYGAMLNILALEFNEIYPDYQVQVINYEDASSDIMMGLELGRQRLNLDIITGQGPDMFHLEGLPVRQYAAIGLLEDLYPYLDADEELSREDIIPQLLAAWDMDGKLYSVDMGFNIITVCGRADLPGVKQGLDYAGFLRLMEQYPQASKPFSYAGSLDVLENICCVELGNYVDWQAGTCSFDSADFISLLEFVARLPREVERQPDAEDALASGEALLMSTTVRGFYDPQRFALPSQGEIIFTGLPTAHGSGSAFTSFASIGMSSQSQNKQACWLFLRFLLSQQLQESVSGLPSNQAAFNTWLETAMTVRYADGNGEVVEPHHSILSSTPGRGAIKLYQVTPEEADQLLGLIETTDAMAFTDPFIMRIIREEAAAFLAGQNSAEKAASLIQTRASIYMSEQR